MSPCDFVSRLRPSCAELVEASWPRAVQGYLFHGTQHAAGDASVAARLNDAVWHEGRSREGWKATVLSAQVGVGEAWRRWNERLVEAAAEGGWPLAGAPTGEPLVDGLRLLHWACGCPPLSARQWVHFHDLPLTAHVALDLLAKVRQT